MNERRIDDQPISIDDRRKAKADRRKHLRIFCDESLEHWLSAVAQRNNVYDLVVGDLAGGLIASARECDESFELAAAMCQVNTDGEMVAADHKEGCLVVRAFRWQESQLLLGAVGEEEKAHAAVEEAATRIVSILSGT